MNYSNVVVKCKNACPLGKVDGICCEACPHCEDCLKKCEHEPDMCGEAVFEGTALEVFKAQAQELIKSISFLMTQKAQIEAAEKNMRDKLQKAMEAHGVKQFDNDTIKVTYVEASTRSSVDTTKLKNKYPDIADECTKSSEVKAFVKIELKGE